MIKHVYKKFIWFLIGIISIIFAGHHPFVFAASITFSDLSAFTLNGSSANIHGGGPVLSNGKNILRFTSSAGVGEIAGSAFAPVVPRLNNGSIWHTWIDYDGTTDLLEIRLSESAARPTSPLLSHTLDLISDLGSPNIYAVFTAGIASARNDQDMRSWQFNSTQAAVVPEPSSILLYLYWYPVFGLVSMEK